MSGNGIGGHHTRDADTKDEWLTPPELLDKLGAFDLDPCSPINRTWPTAAHHLTIIDDGLRHPWQGRVWLNPPYGDQTGRWLERLRAHGDGIALVFARTETAWFFAHAWDADALLFLDQRLNFHHVDGTRSSFNSGAPSVLLAYGSHNVTALADAGITGALVTAAHVIRPGTLL